MPIIIANRKFEQTLDCPKIYVGRPNALGNPFPTKRNRFTEKIYSTEESLKLYRKWLWHKIKTGDGQVLSALTEIRQLSAHSDIALVCWCVDENGDGECHAKIIKSCVEWMCQGERKASEIYCSYCEKPIDTDKFEYVSEGKKYSAHESCEKDEQESFFEMLTEISRGNI